ncbi:DUF1501 domain-containing protein [Litorilinea aerophila]|uniref:DUF1501 domain-containing protein n=1 Tax=Litorilinea aerophila TaxID=1204385 RepID=A0A540VGD7_9CHLR|nr:DUF1501 domain-containing protein [Litorilinea aerophila]MCC9077151.1 DUF1501 domain-containing protein [Litorilinea aerophila]GIV76096.1 MAG: hypothetical protein KatS3mg050_0490 [Litorilinea sp.]
MFKVSRRGFLVGCSTAIAAMTGGISFTAFGSAEDEPNQDILLVIFLRGGCDGLSVVMPIAGDDRGYYEDQRREIAIPASGTNAALNLDDFFGLHPAAAHLHELFQEQRLAIVHAAGLTSDTRSHFDAMQYMELGTPGSKSATTGWLTRHLQTAGNLPSEIILPALAVGNLQPTSLAGSNESIGMNSPDDFSFGGHWRYGSWMRQALRDMYAGGTWLHQAGLQTLNAVDVIEWASPDEYTPGNGAAYPDTEFGRNLQSVAQMIKMQLGLRVATVDLGGWDTHEYQGDEGGGYFASQLGQLSQGLAALYTDLSNVNGTDHTRRLTMVVMSEFGRSFRANESRGTDHGHGNVMLVLGGQVNGGRVYGQWPGLHTDQLYDRRDLEITTDYRRVLSELLIRRLGNPNLGTIFPGYTDYQPLGIVQGTDLTPIYDQAGPTPTPQATPAPQPSPTADPGGSSDTSRQVFIPLVSR